MFSSNGALTADQYRYEGWYPYDYDYDYSDPSFVDPPYTIGYDDQKATWYGALVQGTWIGSVP